MNPARQVLERLLQKGERARLRGDRSPASLPMTTEASAHAYLSLQTLAEREAFHAGIALAERAGAVAVERDRHRGDGERLLRISIADLDALAAHLGTELLQTRTNAAAALMSAWLVQFPVLVDVLGVWRNGRKVRGHGPEAAPELADAARAVDASRRHPGSERILRRESVRLFGDSKRLEAISPWLEILTTGELAATGLPREDVWAAIGLRREPQPLLLAGNGIARLDDATLPLVRPYLGVPVESLRGLTTDARYLMTIENLASFHDAVHAPAAASGLLLYTGGMPSPAWRRAYARIIEDLPASIAVYHWSDIDEGGFRIAAVLAEVARSTGHDLRPWRMSKAALRQTSCHNFRSPTPSTLAAMCKWAVRAGWDKVAADLERHPILLEQESIDVLLPTFDGCS